MPCRPRPIVCTSPALGAKDHNNRTELINTTNCYPPPHPPLQDFHRPAHPSWLPGLAAPPPKRKSRTPGLARSTCMGRCMMVERAVVRDVSYIVKRGDGNSVRQHGVGRAAAVCSRHHLWACTIVSSTHLISLGRCLPFQLCGHSFDCVRGQQKPASHLESTVVDSITQNNKTNKGYCRMPIIKREGGKLAVSERVSSAVVEDRAPGSIVHTMQ